MEGKPHPDSSVPRNAKYLKEVNGSGTTGTTGAAHTLRKSKGDTAKVMWVHGAAGTSPSGQT